MICVKDVALWRGIKPLFSQVSFTLYKGQKIGLVGQNGCGKTSLISLISGALQSDKGDVEVAKGTRIVTVRQEIENLDLTVLEYVLEGLGALNAIREQMEQALAQENYEAHAQFHADFEALGGYQIEAKASALLAGLGFSEQALVQPVQGLSGGWRIRLNLAQALLQEADLMLLDEPTNHLDLDAVIWLEKYLQNYRGAVLLISHDRIFLDHVVSGILHIENKSIKSFCGNYSAFEHQYGETRELVQKTHRKQKAKIAHLESFVRRFRAKASKAKQAQSRLKMLEKMQKIETVNPTSAFSFSFSDLGKKPSGRLIRLEHAALGYGKTAPVLSAVSLKVLPEMRIGLLGQNGAGKSTLIKSLVGKLPLLSGIIETHPDLRIGYFSQHALETLDGDASPLLHLERLNPAITSEKARQFLGRFNFSDKMALNRVSDFSGGEKARLALTLIVYLAPNFLVLDEPTNHLDIPMREALAYALQAFQGALMLISHDRYLLESTVDEYWRVDQGELTGFQGDLNDYYQYLCRRKKNNSAKKVPSSIAGTNNKKANRKIRTEKRAALKPLQNEMKALERKIEILQTENAQLNAQLQDRALYQDKEKRNRVLAQSSKVKRKLELLESEWLQASERFDEACKTSSHQTSIKRNPEK